MKETKEIVAYIEGWMQAIDAGNKANKENLVYQTLLALSLYITTPLSNDRYT